MGANTAFAEKFTEAGISQRAVRLAIAVAEFQNNGGTYAEARGILDRAYAGAQTAVPADSAPKPAAVPDMARRAPRAVVAPSAPRRGAAAIASVQSDIARSIFDSVKLPDGRTLRQVQWHELPKLALEYQRLGRVFTLLHEKVQPTDTFLTLDKVLRESEVLEAIAKAAKAV